MRERIIFLVGPTALGKSEAGARLAKKINAEIISCDSMQVYKGMDTITSKPALALRKSIPHHLISIVSPEKEYNVSRYFKDANRKIKEILRHKKIPLIIGGTGLYMSVLVDGIFKMKAPPKEIREKLYALAKARGSRYLFDKLNAVDPEAASKIHPHDTRRIVRALEVFEATGKPISCLQKTRLGIGKDYEVRIFCLDLAREKLYKRIDARVDKMLKAGLIAEVKKLLKLKLSKTARFAIGINEVKGYLHGNYDLNTALEKMKHNTRLYAKRQLTWFRKDKRIRWIKMKGNEKPCQVAQNLAHFVSGTG